MPSASININLPSIPRVDKTALLHAGFDALQADLSMPSIEAGDLVGIQSIQAQVNAITNCVSCEQLNKVAQKTLGDLEIRIKELLETSGAMAPLLDLFTVGKDPIGWIVRFVNTFLSVYMQPYFAAIEEAEALVQIVSQIAHAVESATKNIEGCNLDVTVNIAP